MCLLSIGELKETKEVEGRASAEEAEDQASEEGR